MTAPLRPPRPAFFLLPALLFWCGMLFPWSSQAGSVFLPGVEPGSNVKVEVASWLETSPQFGAVPLRVKIQNGDDKPHTWMIRATCSGDNGTVTNAEISVEPRQSAEMTMYATLPVRSNSYYYGGLTIMVTGHGINQPFAGSLNANSVSYRSSATPYIAMGKRLSSKGWSTLRNRLNTASKGRASSELLGSEVDVVDAPDDWRGYSGLEQFWLDAPEWLALGAEKKAAVMEWVALGGRLFVTQREGPGQSMKELFPMLAGEVSDGSAVPYGGGAVATLKWDGNAFPLEEVTKRVKADTGAWENLGDYASGWGLLKEVGELKLKYVLIFGFIVVFGILIGPVNLFFLAGSSRRHRLFWTTPLIALLSTVVLVLLMVLQDGTGGEGRRTVVVRLLPELKRMVVTQEQVSRTGVLLGTSFPVAEPSMVMPLEVDRDRSSPRFSASPSGEYFEDGTRRWGKWFSSRSVQAHLVQAVRPSRAALEVSRATIGGGVPQIASSLEVPLAKVFVLDEQKRYWAVSDLGTGERKALEPATRDAFLAWRKALVDDMAGPVVAKLMNPTDGQPGHVYAEAAGGGQLAVATLESIVWKDERVIVTGRYVTRP